MESCMVRNVYNFKNGIEAYNYLIQLLDYKFPDFEVIKTSEVDILRSKFGYFDVYILYKNAKFIIRCERGVLHYECEFDNQKIGLHHFNQGMNDVLAFSKENLEYTLLVFKRYVDEKSLFS